MDGPPESLRTRVADLVGRPPVAWRRAGAGFTPAERWIVTFPGGSTVFVKAGAEVNPDTAEWLRIEHEVYSHVSGPFLAQVLGWHDDGGSDVVLLLEDLSGGEWPPPWSPEKVDRVLGTLDAIHASGPPGAVPTLESERDGFQGWKQIGEDPGPFLGLGLCSDDWLEHALPRLIEAEVAADFAGGDLLHLDVRSDNICFAGERTVLVDWNWACSGNGRLDVVSWLPSLALEGGPPPQAMVDDEPELGAVIAGFFARRAPMPEIPFAPRVRTIQKAQLRVALPWAAGMLDLPPPDLSIRP